MKKLVNTFLNILVLLKVVVKCDISCFKILNHASTYSQLKIKDSFHIEQLKPELNKKHVSSSCLQRVLVYFLLFIFCVCHFIG